MTPDDPNYWPFPEVDEMAPLIRAKAKAFGVPLSFLRPELQREGLPPEEFRYFDHTHWLKVYTERRRLGLPDWDLQDRVVLDHPILRVCLRERKTGKLYRVLRVTKNFFAGQFLQAVVENEGSHRLLYFENISSRDQVILQAVQTFREEWEAVETATYA